VSGYGITVFTETDVSRLLRITQPMLLIMVDRDPALPISLETSIFIPPVFPAKWPKKRKMKLE